MARLLKLAGYEVLCACNGSEALKILETAQPALILLDLGMPVMDGVTFLSIIRDDPRWATLPVVVITGETPVGGKRLAREYGADEVMTKGHFRIDELFANIRRYIPDEVAGLA